MIAELVYTSVPKGLAAGSSGFATVAYTEGLPQPLILACELLSSYRHLFPPGDARENLNPVLFSHFLVTCMDRPFSVISRVAAFGADYSGRTNKLAHHLVISPEHRVPQGPAQLLLAAGLMRADWRRPPAVLPFSPWLASAPEPGACRAVHWERRTGWAGWAGVLAGAFMESPRRPAYLVFEPGTETLPLIAEAIALLPPAARWKVTFSTYFTAIPQSLECLWRGCLPSSDILARARRQPGTLVLDLTGKQRPPDLETPWIKAALTGQPPDWTALAMESSQPPAGSTKPGTVRSQPTPAPHARDTFPASILEHPHRPRKRMLTVLIAAVALAIGAWRLATRNLEESLPPPSPSATPAATPEAPTPSLPPETDVVATPAAVPAPVTPVPVGTPVAEPLPETPPAEVVLPAPDESTPELRPYYECIIPRVEKIDPRTWTLAGLPSDLADAQQGDFHLAPGYRAARTNGTLFATGLSGALAGRGEGEMSLIVYHPQLGQEEIHLRLRDQVLRAAGSPEWLAALTAIEIRADNAPPRIILCSAPWRLPFKDMFYDAPRGRLILSLETLCGPGLAERLPFTGQPGDWTARLGLSESMESAPAVGTDPETGRFALQLSEKDRDLLRRLQTVRDRQPLREPSSVSAADDEAPTQEDWVRLLAHATDWTACGWDVRELVQPLDEWMAAHPEYAAPDGPIRPDAREPAPLVEGYKLAVTGGGDAPGCAAVLRSICAGSEARLRQATAPLRALETGPGVKLELFYRGQPAMIAGEH